MANSRSNLRSELRLRSPVYWSKSELPKQVGPGMLIRHARVYAICFGQTDRAFLYIILSAYEQPISRMQSRIVLAVGGV
jgi:hypothetical protein